MINTLTNNFEYLNIYDDNNNTFNLIIYKNKDNKNKDNKNFYLDIDELSHIFKIDIINIINFKKTIDTNELLYTENKYYKKILNNNNLQIYLTFKGFITLILTEKIPHFNKYYKEIIKTLFIIQFGTKNQKKKITSKLLGIDLNYLKNLKI